jgi:hypothetical protein
MECFKDGVLMGIYDRSGFPSEGCNNSRNLTIGCVNSEGTYQEFSNGRFSIACLWNRALSAGEVLQNFNVHKSRFGR